MKSQELLDISGETEDLVERVEETADPAVIEQLGRSGEAAVATALLRVLLREAQSGWRAFEWLSSRTNVARAAAGALGELTRTVPDRALPAFARWVRGRARGGRRARPTVVEEWRELTPSQLSLFESYEEAGPHFWGLLSMHPSGFVREAAVEHLVSEWSGRVIRYLLLRANDWVAAVRVRARRELVARTRPPHAAAFADHLGLVERLRDCERADHRVVVDEVAGLLRGEAGAGELVRVIEEGPREVARSAFEMATEGRSEATRPAIRAALGSDDVVVRRRAVEAAGAYFSESEFEDILLDRLDDPHRDPRRVALEAYVERFPDRAESVLRDALFDSAGSIRQFGRFHLEDAGVGDVAERYRAGLEADDVSTVRGAIKGLGEVGDAGDGPLIRPFADAQDSPTRRIAVRALADLDADRYESLFYERLDSSIGSNARAAASALEQVSGPPDPERLWPRVVEAPTAAGRKSALRLLGRAGHWERLPYLLRAATLEDETLAEQAVDLVAEWMQSDRGTFVEPSGEQVRRVERALEGAWGALPGELRDALEHRFEW